MVGFPGAHDANSAHEAHKRADTDSEPFSIHHTLGHGPNQAAAGNHNHDTDYSATTHNHDTAYSAILHNHDAVYSLLTHNHNAVYSAITHNHDADYSDIAHTHTAHYPKYCVSASDNVAVAFTVATKILGVTMPSADLVDGAKYRVQASFDMSSSSAGSSTTFDLKHGLSATVGGTSIRQSIITAAVASRRYHMTWYAEFTYSGTSGDTPYNVNIVGSAPSAGTSTVASNLSWAYITVDRIA